MKEIDRDSGGEEGKKKRENGERSAVLSSIAAAFQYF